LGGRNQITQGLDSIKEVMQTGRQFKTNSKEKKKKKKKKTTYRMWEEQNRTTIGGESARKAQDNKKKDLKQREKWMSYTDRVASWGIKKGKSTRRL